MLLPQEAAVSFRRTQRNVRSGNAKPSQKGVGGATADAACEFAQFSARIDSVGK